MVTLDYYDPWYIELNPKMTVPTMRYGDMVVGDTKDAGEAPAARCRDSNSVGVWGHDNVSRNGTFRVSVCLFIPPHVCIKIACFSRAAPTSLVGYPPLPTGSDLPLICGRVARYGASWGV